MGMGPILFIVNLYRKEQVISYILTETNEMIKTYEFFGKRNDNQTLWVPSPIFTVYDLRLHQLRQA